MRLFQFIILLLTLPGAVSAGARDPVKSSPLPVAVDWSCPATEGTEAVPVEKKLDFTFDPTNGHIVGGREFAELLDIAATKYPQIDFFECGQAVVEAVNSAVQNRCEELKKTGTDKGAGHARCALKNSTMGIAAEYSIMSWVIRYGASANARGAFPPFAPASPARGTLKYGQMRADLQYTCGQQLDPSFLDIDFMKSLDKMKDMKLWETDAEGKMTQSTSQTTSPACLHEIAQNYAQLLRSAEPTEKQCAAQAQTCAERREGIKRAMVLLTNAGLLVDAPEAQLSADCLAKPEIIDAKLRKIIDSDDLTTCGVQPGDIRRIQGNMGTGVVSSYTLRRFDDYQKQGNYEVTVDLDFRKSGGAADPKLALKYEKKARECYAEARPKLRGPKGEFLAIRLFKDNPGSVRPKTRRIEIVDSDARSNSDEWREGIDCPTILHETMHVLGLSDEYREWARGANVDKKTGAVVYTTTKADKGFAAYDCRAFGPPDSLMVDQGAAYDSVALTRILGIFKRTPKRPSLLFPAQFNTIIAPGCGVVNKTYYACSKDAYRTSLKAYGKGCTQDKPNVCQTPAWVGQFGYFKK